MRSAVLDTDVVSFLFKNETRGHLYRHLLMGIIPIISFMTLAELDLWALSRNWGVARQERMKHHLHAYMVLSVDRGLCEMWAWYLTSQSRRVWDWLAQTPGSRPLLCIRVSHSSLTTAVTSKALKDCKSSLTIQKSEI